MKQEDLNWTIVLKDKDLPKDYQELIEYCHSKNWIFSYPKVVKTITIKLAKNKFLWYDYEKQKIEIHECKLDEDGHEVVENSIEFEGITTEQVCIITEGFLIKKPVAAISKLKAEIDYFKRTKDALINKYNFAVDGDIIKMYDEDIAIRERRLKELGGW